MGCGSGRRPIQEAAVPRDFATAAAAVAVEAPIVGVQRDYRHVLRAPAQDMARINGRVRELIPAFASGAGVEIAIWILRPVEALAAGLDCHHGAAVFRDPVYRRIERRVFIVMRHEPENGVRIFLVTDDLHAPLQRAFLENVLFMQSLGDDNSRQLRLKSPSWSAAAISAKGTQLVSLALTGRRACVGAASSIGATCRDGGAAAG